MGKILDLSVFRRDTLDVTLPDMSVVRIDKPSQNMVIAMLNLRYLNENAPSERIARAIDDLVEKILNSNVDGREFGPADISALTLEMKSALIEAYADFAYEVQANPTSASPAAPEGWTAEKAKTKRSLRALFMR